MNMREAGRERGRRAGAEVKKAGDFADVMSRSMRMNRELYPTLGDVDMAAAVRDYDRERLACTPDYTMFPELRGLIDRHLGEREGFIEASGLDETAAAFNYSFHWWIQKRVNCRHVARYDLATPQLQCTNVFFPEGRDGVTISDNRDDVPRPWYAENVGNFRLKPARAGDKVHWTQGGVSSATHLDEEPKNIFPAHPKELMPEECKSDIREVVKFMERYNDWWGPGNQIWVDRELRAVAVEKTNCRVAFRYPEHSGAVCVTACSYLDPDLAAFKRRQTLKAAKEMGDDETTSLDLRFGEGCDRRHRRLWKLTNEEAQRPGGATLWGAFNVVADTAVPFPDRICLAGEKTDPKREPNANWTLTQHAQVITGAKRRGLFRSIEDVHHPRPITSYTPKLILGEGVEMDPEWQKDIDAGRCRLADDTREPKVNCPQR